MIGHRHRLTGPGTPSPLSVDVQPLLDAHPTVGTPTREIQPQTAEEGYRLTCPNNAATRLIHATEHVREILVCISGELCFLSRRQPQGTAQGLRADARLADVYLSIILAPRSELWVWVGPGGAATADISWWVAED